MLHHPLLRVVRRRAGAVVAAVVAALMLFPAVVPSDAGASAPVTQTPVMGPSLLSAPQLAAWFHHTRGSTPANLPSLHNDVQALAQIFIDEGNAQGVRGDIAFAQSMLETGWLGFVGSQVPPGFNNYSGLFAFNNRPAGTTCAAETAPSRCFATPILGVRNQIQLLRGYADASTRTLPMLIRPPSDRIGLAPYWERFGGQQLPIVWATAPNYGQYVLQIYAGALVYNGFNVSCLPFYTGGVGRTTGNGYWLMGRNGSAYPFGSAPDYGNVANLNLRGPVVDAEATPDHKGYWMLGYDGGVFSFGSARFYGSLGGVALWAPVNDFATVPNGQGYWLAAYDGGVFTFGGARFFGSLGGHTLPAQIVGMEATRTGQGYWLLAADGTLYPFGNARSYGSPKQTTHKMVELKRTPSSNGYYELRDDGYVYAYGDAVNYGNAAACGVGHASHMIVTPTGHGYWIVTSSGIVLSFGDAKPLGMLQSVQSVGSGISGFAFQG